MERLFSLRHFTVFAMLMLSQSLVAQDLGCQNQISSVTAIADPAKWWEEDTSLVPGVKSDPNGVVEAYVVGDKLDLRREQAISLYRTRNLPNAKVSRVTFDGREIDLDMPLVFESTTITFYANTLKIGPRGSIVLTLPPSQVDGITIVVDTLDIAEAPLHPFVFVTADSKWPGASRRFVTVFANKLKTKLNKQQDSMEAIRALTLDETYSSVAKGGDPGKAYSVSIGTEEASAQVSSYLTKEMSWPLESAEKINRQFSAAPFDGANKRFVAGKIDWVLSVLPPNSHQLARGILFKVTTAMRNGVDNFGFYPNYVPRRFYPTIRQDFTATEVGALNTLATWDSELVASQDGNDFTTAVTAVDANVRKLNDQIDAEHDSINDAITSLSVHENRITTLKGLVEKAERDIQASIDDEKKKDETNYKIKVGTSVVVMAASLVPVSAPVAIAIGTAAGVTGNAVLRFNQGQAATLGAVVMDVPTVLAQAKAFNTKANTLVNQWSDVKSKYDTFKQKPTGSSEVGPAREALVKSVGDFVQDLRDVVSSVNPPEPSQVRQSGYERENGDLQNALHAIGDVRAAEAEVSAKLIALQKQLEGDQQQITTLEGQRRELTRFDAKDDHGRAVRQSIAWTVRQDQLRTLLYQAIVLLRSYKYHTGGDTPGAFNESHFASKYRLSGAIENATDSQNDFFRTQGRTTLQARLAATSNDLKNDLDTMLTYLDQGYKHYKDGIAGHPPYSPVLSLNCSGLQPGSRLKNPKCVFIRALNDELTAQVKNKDPNRPPLLIPLPVEIKRSFHAQPAKLVDISVTIEYSEPQKAQDFSVILNVLHPYFGKLWGKAITDCSLIDMRRFDANENMQAYASTCNAAQCSHNDLTLPEVLTRETQEHAPLPLDTVYYFEPRVQGFGNSVIPVVKTVRVKLLYTE